jgi:hypothetical protein
MLETIPLLISSRKKNGATIDTGTSGQRASPTVSEQNRRHRLATDRIGTRLLKIISFKQKVLGSLGDEKRCPVEGNEGVTGDRDVPVAAFAVSIFVQVR